MDKKFRDAEDSLHVKPDILAKREVIQKWNNVKSVAKTKNLQHIQDAIQAFESIACKTNNIPVEKLRKRQIYSKIMQELLEANTFSSGNTHGNARNPGGQTTSVNKIIRGKLETLYDILNTSAEEKSFHPDAQDYEIRLLNDMTVMAQSLTSRQQDFKRRVNSLSKTMGGETSDDVNKCLELLEKMETQMKSGSRRSGNDTANQQGSSRTHMQDMKAPYTIFVVDKMYRYFLSHEQPQQQQQRQDMDDTIYIMQVTESQAEKLKFFIEKTGLPPVADIVEAGSVRQDHHKQSSIQDGGMEKLQKKIHDLQERLQSADEEKQRWESRQVVQFEEKMQHLEAKLQSLENEKKYWMDRASRVAGTKLTENNPGISDLSDPDRPQKLAERYGEIYDNVWTEAMENLKPRNETEGVKMLRDVLRTCHVKCIEHADAIAKQLRFEIFQIITGKSKIKAENIPQSLRNSLTSNFIKCIYEATNVPLINEAIEKLVTDRVLDDYPKDTKGKIKKYVTACVSLCWKMIVKNPPMCFIWPVAGKDQPVDEDRFTFYTRSGKYIDFVVWPAMILCEGGPLLRKGVLQPFPKK